MFDTIDDAFPRKAAAVVRGEQVVAEAVQHHGFIKEEVDRGEYAFTAMPSPKNFLFLEATNRDGSSILVWQFNHRTTGIGHAGTAIRMTPSDPMIVNFPKELADHIYHQATATWN